MFLLAAIVGFGFTFADLLTAKYPRTFFLISKSGTLWGYCAVYGLLAAAVYLGLDALVAAKQIEFTGGFLGSPWQRAIAIGLATKSLGHINLFNISVGGQPVPIGIGTLMQMFEPHMLRGIQFDEFNAVREYLESYAGNQPDLAAVKQRIEQNIPPDLPAQEVGAFKDAVGRTTDVMGAMEHALRFLGRKTFSRLFPRT